MKAVEVMNMGTEMREIGIVDSVLSALKRLPDFHLSCAVISAAERLFPGLECFAEPNSVQIARAVLDNAWTSCIEGQYPGLGSADIEVLEALPEANIESDPYDPRSLAIEPLLLIVTAMKCVTGGQSDEDKHFAVRGPIEYASELDGIVMFNGDREGHLEANEIRYQFVILDQLASGPDLNQPDIQALREKAIAMSCDYKECVDLCIRLKNWNIKQRAPVF
jgi:hypothetical protein